jgi:hypothetical protein
MEKPGALWRRLTIFAEKKTPVLHEQKSQMLHAQRSNRYVLLGWNKSPELNVGVDYAFAKRDPRIGDFYAAASKIPCFFTFTVEANMYSVLVDLIRAGCGGGAPHIAY